MRTRTAVLAAFIITFSATSNFVRCEDNFSLPSMTLADVQAMPSPRASVPQVSPAPVEKEWTLMVFMNGKSNVEQFALGDMNELEAAGSGPNVNVVVELGRMKGQEGDTDADGNWTGSRRYLVTKDSDPQKITSPVLMQIPQLDMGDYRRVVDFVLWSKKNFPAKKYMLILWDHGWGWIDPKAYGSKRSISHDFQTGHYIKTMEMGPMLREMHGVDVYASMACFMQMAEIAYEIKDAAKVIVGSEEVIQMPSFDFTAIASRLNAYSNIGPEAAGVLLVDAFHDLYTFPAIYDDLIKTKYGVQLSAIRAYRMNEFAKRVSEWAQMAQAANNPKAIKFAKRDVLRFELGELDTDPYKLISFYGDLYNFVEIVNYYTPAENAELKLKSAQLMNFIEKELVIKNTFAAKDRTGKDYKNAHGISIHIPGAPGHLVDYVNNYVDLSFSKATYWPWFAGYINSVQ